MILSAGEISQVGICLDTIVPGKMSPELFVRGLIYEGICPRLAAFGILGGMSRTYKK